MKDCLEVEWANSTRYNSFNSYKGLTYYENYKNIVAWLNSETNKLAPPVECNLDPFAECNLNCYFCITQRYLRTNRAEVGEMRTLPTEYMLRLVDFLAKWGVRGLCISGGGEPSLHKGIASVIEATVGQMDVAFVTNATLIDDKLAEALMLCRWVALSIDSSNRNTYRAVKGKDYFQEATGGVEKLTKLRARTGAKVDLCFKFLILPENQLSIYDTCKLAKELGVQDFHARPVDFERKDIVGNKQLVINKDIVEEQFAKCHQLEDRNFHTYTVTHKFDPEFHIKHDFKKCLATPLVIPILQDGNAYLCVDKKMESKFRLGSCYPEPEQILTWWGSKGHRQMIRSVNIEECSRCTWSQYNRQVEEAVIEDKMCLAFP